MSIKVMSWVWADSPAEGSDRLVLLAIADEANDQGFCWPGFERLARKARVSRRTVIRSIQQLEASGQLLVRRGGEGPGDSNRYVVVMERPVDELIERFEMGDKLAPQGEELRVTSAPAMGDNDGAIRVPPVAPDPSTHPQEHPAGAAPLAQGERRPPEKQGDPGIPREQVARAPGFASLRAQLHGEAPPLDATELLAEADAEVALVDR